MGASDSRPRATQTYHDPQSPSVSLPEKKRCDAESALGRTQKSKTAYGTPSSRGCNTGKSFPSPCKIESDTTSSLFRGGGGEEFISSEAVPLHIDSRSVVYASPSCAPLSPLLEDFIEFPPYYYSSSSNSKNEEGSTRLEPTSPDSPFLLEEFIIAPPAVPLLDNFLHGRPPHQLEMEATEGEIKSISGFLATPQYNLGVGGKSEELLLHSPVLRSYHAKSFPVLAPAHSGGNATSHTLITCTNTVSGSKVHSSNSNSSSSGGGGGVVLGLTKNISGSFGSISMGVTSSGGGNDNAGPHSRFLDIRGDPLGLENCGNTCYANSVIQLIYHCVPLRLRLLELHEAYKARRGVPGFQENTVLYAFCSLIGEMHKANNLKPGEGEKVIPTRNFLVRVAEKNSMFRSEQQDAHEFCMFLLNELIEAEKDIMRIPKNAKYFREQHGHGSSKFGLFLSSSKGSGSNKSTWQGKECAEETEKSLSPLQSILQGSFVTTTACLSCGNITYCKDDFLDLSLETRQGCSLLDCLAHFGDPSLFVGTNKLKCAKCNALANAANTIHVEELPHFALLIHLKRFRYDPMRRSFTKTAHHVALPMEMDVEEYQMKRSQPSRVQGEKTAQSAFDGKEHLTRRSSSESDEEPCQSPLSPPLAWTETAQVSLTSLEKNETPRSCTPSAPPPPAAAVFTGIPPDVRTALDGVVESKARFELTGFVAHLGEGPSLGHYFTCTRYGPNLWRRFDDGVVTTMSRREVEQLFGVPIDVSGMLTTTAYILLYERVA